MGSQVDDEAQLTQETALPSSTRPSDHVSLVATFKFRDFRDNSNDPSPPARSNRNLMGHTQGYGHHQLGAFPGNGGYGNNAFTSSNSNSFTTACALSGVAQQYL